MSDYGTQVQVEALTKRYTNAGNFDSQSYPTNTQVNTWLNELSSMMNVLLAGEGFVIPITETVVKPMIDQIVTVFCRDMVEFANSAGRFYNDKRLKGGNMMMWINQDFQAWIDAAATGMQAAGAERSQSLAGGILTKNTNADGNTIEPFFNESGFGIPRPTSL